MSGFSSSLNTESNNALFSTSVIPQHISNNDCFCSSNISKTESFGQVGMMTECCSDELAAKNHFEKSFAEKPKEKNEGEPGMSLCIAFATPEKNIYLAADSFSSVSCEYDNLFSRDVRYRTVDESYQKIVHFEIASRHIAAYSTGTNGFGKEKLGFKKAVEGIDLSGCKDIKDGIPFVCNRFFELGAAGDFQITFFSASEDGFTAIDYQYTAQSQPTGKWDIKDDVYKKNRPTLYARGAEWARALLPHINLKTESYIESEETPINFV